MKIAIVSHSAGLATPPAVSTDDLQAFAKAVGGQLAEVAARWGRVPPEAIFVAQPYETLDDGTFELGIWDQPDQPNAAGYHSVDPRGKPYGKVFWSLCDGVRTAPTLSLSQLLSHEAVELFINRFVNCFVLRSDGKTFDSCEPCDAVEDVVYKDPGGTGCDLSNYLLPAAFGESDTGPFDRQGVLRSRCDTTPGGYRSTLQADVADSGDLRIRCIAYYGANHAMADSDPSETVARRQQAKSQSVRARTKVAAVEWRAIGQVPLGNSAGVHAAAAFQRARAALLDIPAAPAAPTITPPVPPRHEIPPPAPRAPVTSNPASNRSAARRGAPSSAARTRVRTPASQGRTNIPHRVTSHPNAARLRSRNAPLPQRPVRFHDAVMKQQPQGAGRSTPTSPVAHTVRTLRPAPNFPSPPSASSVSAPPTVIVTRPAKAPTTIPISTAVPPTATTAASTPTTPAAHPEVAAPTAFPSVTAAPATAPTATAGPSAAPAVHTTAATPVAPPVASAPPATAPTATTPAPPAPVRTAAPTPPTTAAPVTTATVPATGTTTPTVVPTGTTPPKGATPDTPITPASTAPSTPTAAPAAPANAPTPTTAAPPPKGTAAATTASPAAPSQPSTPTSTPKASP